MGGERSTGTNGASRAAYRQREKRLAALAGRQHRVVTRRQLARLGLTRGQIQGRLATVRLTRLYPEVFAAGPGELDLEGAWLAAALACGPEAVVSHWAAAAAWRLRIWRRGPIDVTTPRRVRVSGIRSHRSELPGDERTILRGLPVSSVGRTILDCAAHTDVRGVERLINEAHVLGLPAKRPLGELLERYPGRRGSVAARAALARFEEGPARVDSELEERFLGFFERWDIPRPRPNRRVKTAIGLIRVDFLWPKQRLVIEVDGFRTHGTRPRMVRDRRRDRALAAAGWRHGRVMAEDLEDEPSLARDINGLLWM